MLDEYVNKNSLSTTKITVVSKFVKTGTDSLLKYGKIFRFTQVVDNKLQKLTRHWKSKFALQQTLSLLFPFFWFAIWRIIFPELNSWELSTSLEKTKKIVVVS